MKRALLAAAVALAPAIGWAQLPPSPPIQSEPLPPPTMQAPSTQPGPGQPQPPGGGAPGLTRPTVPPPAALGQEGLRPTPVPSAPQPPQPPGAPPTFPPSAEAPTAPSPPTAPPPGQPPQQAGQPATPGYAPGAPGQPAPTAPGPPPNEWIPQSGAILQVLDKVNATTATLHVGVGQSAAYGSLHIQVLACDIRPPNMPRDAAASLVIKDTNPDQPGFQGWMLHNEPFLSMLQSPSYDVRVEGCTP